jgi:hypothetical protein
MSVRTRHEKRGAAWDKAGRPADLARMHGGLVSDGARWEHKKREISEAFLDFAADSMNAKLAGDVYSLYCIDCVSRNHKGVDGYRRCA